MTSFSPAWLAGDARALALLPAHFRDAAARRGAVARASERAVPPAVLDIVRAQNAALPASAARDRNVAALGEHGTTCVVTGQQVGLFLGPLYTVYKAASAIAAARALEQETGTRCVPVFWLQTEDHDVAEIDHVSVPRASGEPLRVSVARAAVSVASGAAVGVASNVPAADERVPVAHLTLGPAVEGALAALRAELGAHPHAAEHLDVLARAYTPAATFSDAFARVLAHLFRDDLVFIDPRDRRLAPHTALVHARALTDAPAIARALAQGAAALTSAGFDTQVHVRPGAPLSFFSPDAADGPRFRLDPAPVEDGSDRAGAWRLVGRDAAAPITTEALLDVLAREPMRFSTSALLRPILQDTWLPTAAYVGGPAEMAYFAQLGPLYAHFGMAMPLPVPRARFRVLDDRARALLDKLALAPDDLTQPRDTLLARIAARANDASGAGAGAGAHEAPENIERRLLDALDAELQALAPTLAALDPSLAKATTRTREAVHEAVGKLIGKYARALAQRDSVSVERLERLTALLLPNGEPQERVYGISYYAARFGDAFVRAVVDAVEPFAAAHKELSP